MTGKVCHSEQALTAGAAYPASEPPASEPPATEHPAQGDHGSRHAMAMPVGEVDHRFNGFNPTEQEGWASSPLCCVTGPEFATWL